MELSLFPTLQAPNEARRELASLADLIDEASLASLEDVVGELVAISVDHGACQRINLRFELLAAEIDGVVDDHGPGARAMARARERRDDSLVLRRIDNLVEEWGTDPAQTRVWFHMPVRRRP